MEILLFIIFICTLLIVKLINKGIDILFLVLFLIYVSTIIFLSLSTYSNLVKLDIKVTENYVIYIIYLYMLFIISLLWFDRKFKFYFYYEKIKNYCQIKIYKILTINRKNIGNFDHMIAVWYLLEFVLDMILCEIYIPPKYCIFLILISILIPLNKKWNLISLFKEGKTYFKIKIQQNFPINQYNKRKLYLFIRFFLFLEILTVLNLFIYNKIFIWVYLYILFFLFLILTLILTFIYKKINFSFIFKVIEIFCKILIWLITPINRENIGTLCSILAFNYFTIVITAEIIIYSGTIKLISVLDHDYMFSIVCSILS